MVSKCSIWKVLLPMIILSLLSLTACPHGSMPVGHVRYWMGDSLKAGITRAQDNETIYAVDKKFDSFVCADSQELADRFRELQDACQSWATSKELRDYFEKNKESLCGDK